MADLTFNTTPGSVAERKLMILYLNTGTLESPTWSAVGKRVEDSSMEMDWGEETKKDIFGITYTTMSTPTITQTFDPCELDGADAAQVKLWNLAIKEQNPSALANLDMLVAHLYAGAAATPFAERYHSCAVKPSGLGGSSNIGMPIDVTFGGTRAVGTASNSGGAVTFTEDAA